MSSDAGAHHGLLWEVVGGAGKQGILARAEESLKSEPLAMRLASGTILRQLTVTKDRLQFELVRGSGPDRGWASLRAGGKDLLSPYSDTASAPADTAAAGSAPDPAREPRLPAPAPPPGGLGRKLRVLGLHGGGVNANIMEFQTMPLRRALGACGGTEWVFLDGPRLWKDQEPQSEMLRELAKGNPLRGWYGVEVDNDDDRPYIEKLLDPAVNFRYEEVDEAVSSIVRALETADAPFDVLAGFSQGCIMAHLVAAKLRERGAPIPWKVSLLFCGMRVRDQRFEKLFQPPLDLPCVQVYGKADPYYLYGLDSQSVMYKNPVILDHDEGHKFPSARFTEVNKRIVAELFQQLGNAC